MRCRCQSLLSSVVLTSAMAASAAAFPAPYLRLDYGGNQLKMSEGNEQIRQAEAMFTEAGLPASFSAIKAGYGPSGAVGLWIVPGFRVGATYSYLRSTLENRLHVPGVVFFADDLEFRMTEIGAEAAVRVVGWAGLIVGGSVASGRAEMIEGFAAEDAYGLYYHDAVARRTVTTYGAFIGLDQTNSAGIAGFVRIGYHFRDVGSMPSQLDISDGSSTTRAAGSTVPLDYSGVSVRLGIGYDLAR
jgi:hypothetical protein